MSYRVGLILLQVAGGLSIVPYPAILVANVMAIAAEGQTFAGAIPYVLLSLYPLLWIALDTLSWRALAHGATGWAFLLSSLPVVASLVGIKLFTASSQAGRKRDQERLKPLKANPVAWSVMCYFGPLRYAGTTRLPIDAVLKTIAESAPVRINEPVSDYGTPLRIVLWNLKFKWDGTPVGAGHEDCVRIVRALVARGAELSGDERTFLRDVWRLRLAMIEEPLDTKRENPLVWRIISMEDLASFELRSEEISLLNKPAGLYGTPLLTALLRDEPSLACKLIEAGARLSETEERDPAAAHTLQLLFQDRPELLQTYAS